MIPIIIIEGATATGKTALALKLAQMLNTEIISADSRQVYKYLNIGTAKPTQKELDEVKHHLIDIIKPDETFNAGLFSKKSDLIIRKLHKQGKIPIISGGTGLYVKALLDGLFKGDAYDSHIRQMLETQYTDYGIDLLYAELREVDTVTAERLSKNDKQRILRALEVYRTTGKPISQHWERQQTKSLYLPFRILLDEERDSIYKRIDARINAMVNAGLIEEISAILQYGYKWTDPGFNSVGYKEFKPYIEQGNGLSDCIKLAQQHTRNYAKRQATWYRKCSFNLAGTYSSINISSVEELIKYHFDRNASEA
jgi:tRNA dimethylallyltransferase